MANRGAALEERIAGAAPPATADDPYAAFDPRVRLVAATAFCVAAVAVSSYAALAAALAIALAALAAARPNLRAVGRRLLALEGFMAMIVVMLPFTVPASAPDRILFAWGPLTASGDGLHQALAILLKTNIVVLTLTALIGRLEPTEFGRALAALRMPGKLVTLLLLTVRYLGVLQRDYQRLRRAMQVRGFRARADRHSLRSVGYLVGMLLVRSFDRSERILAAMRCRGFDGTFRHDALAAPGRRDGAFAAVVGLAVLLCASLEVAALVTAA